VHAYCELQFELPSCVRAFQSQVGLDESVGRGGCARGLVYVNRVAPEPLYRSQPLIGSRQIAQTGTLPLAGPAGGQHTLLLVADPIDRDFPPGADPLDIRDMVDWLEPLLELDLEQLKSEVQKRRPAAASAARRGG
jgi:hypothetical protein